MGARVQVLLEAQNIHKSYSDSGKVLHILKGIDIKIEQGEIVSIIGPSGAGKSTLMHILGGLDKPDQGVVQLNGDDIYKLSDKDRAALRNARVGFIFQFYHLLPEFTALENVVLPAMIKEDNPDIKAYGEKGRQLLASVGLEDRAGHKPNQLSGGEQQRVAIARALINQPQIIFCDEPTGNLDSQTGGAIIELLLRFNKVNKQTFLIVTHDQSIAQRSHRSVFMRDGNFSES